MKRRFFIVLLALITVFAFTACGETDSQGSDSESSESSSKEDVVYHVGDTWTVDGLWELTINSVTSTEERDEYYEGEEPAEVISIDYTYKNLGYESADQDLWIYLDSVMDCEGNMCREYYTSADQYSQETPIGGICNAG